MDNNGSAVSTAQIDSRLHSSHGNNINSSLSAMEKLDGSIDYSTWKFMMELYLVHDDLWQYTMTTPDAGDIADVRRDEQPRAKICLMIKPHCLVHVLQAKSAKEAWDALKAAFEDKGLTNRYRLLSKLVSLKLEQLNTVRDYVTSMMTVSQQLSDLGKEIDDELLAAAASKSDLSTYEISVEEFKHRIDNRKKFKP